MQCHGPDGQGSSFAPNLTDSLKQMDYYAFTGVVVGLIVSAVLNLFALEPGHPTWSRSILTLEVTLAALVVGVVWALVADRRSRR